MNIRNRKFDKDTDYKRIMEFLEKSYKENDDNNNWLPLRFEYWYYFGLPFENFRLDVNYEWESQIQIWENEDNELIGFVTPEGSQGDFFIQVNPNYKSLEDEMISWIESNIPEMIKKYGSNKIRIWSFENDENRTNILESKGFKKLDWSGQLRWREINSSIPDIPLCDGYSIKTVDTDENLLKRCNLSGQAFEYKPYPIDVYKNMQRAPLYRRDLDLISTDNKGNYAAFCTVWFDPEIRIGLFEPVGTHPDHRKKGLSKALICEGLKRLKELGAERALVGSYDEPAHMLYNSCGFTQYKSNYPFEKEY